MADDLEVDVAIVGAGPSGLMAGLCLARAGVRSVVLDGKTGPTRESRALGVQARSMELYDQLGLVGEVLDAGRRAPQMVPGAGRRRFARLDFTELGRRLTPYPGVFVLEQSENERILGAAYTASGGDLRWGHRLSRLDVREGDPHPVRLSLDGPDGERTVRARWCIGADGASSSVRQQLGIPFEGTTNPLRFYVADGVGVTGLVEDSLNLRFSRDEFLLAFPMRGAGHHRLLGVLPADDRDALPIVHRMLDAEFGVRFADVQWFSEYRVHHRLAAAFRRGPVFLVGDAAHVHSPVGAQGMNTGLQDAHNLACKLVDVLRRGAHPSLLDRFELERRPVAARLVQTTDAAFARITSGTDAARFVRGSALPVVAPAAVRIVPRVIGTERIYGYLSQTRIHYRMPGYEGRRRGRIVGRRLAWSGENYDALGAFRWQVHGYGAAAGDAVRVGEALGVPGLGFPSDRFGRLQEDRLYLVRPDGFVAAAARPDVAARAFRQALPEGLDGS